MRPSDIDESIRFILENLDTVREVEQHAKGIRHRLVDLTIAGKICERDFYRISSVLTPQSRSSIWQNYFIKVHGARKVARNENRGDFEKRGTFYEFKASGFNVDCVVHIVQIRLWQNCDYVIQSISDNGAVTFILKHGEMKAETEAVGATAAHGTRLVTRESQHVELRMTFGRNSAVWERWKSRYADRSLS